MVEVKLFKKNIIPSDECYKYIKEAVKECVRRLRREIYGDTSLKIERKYVWQRGRLTNHPDSPRARYQLAKKGR